MQVQRYTSTSGVFYGGGGGRLSPWICMSCENILQNVSYSIIFLWASVIKKNSYHPLPQPSLEWRLKYTPLTSVCVLSYKIVYAAFEPERAIIQYNSLIACSQWKIRDISLSIPLFWVQYTFIISYRHLNSRNPVICGCVFLSQYTIISFRRFFFSS